MKKLFKLGVALLMSCSLFILASCTDKDSTKEPDTLTVEQAKENIEKCGLAVDVSLKANIGVTACTVYLDAETGTFEAYDESKTNASLRSASDIKGTLVFKGAFFYNQELWFKVEAQVAADGTESEPEVKYYTVSVDLSKVNEAVLTADGEVDYTSVLVEDKTTTTQSTESDYNEQQEAFEESVKDLDKFREDSKPESTPPAEEPPQETPPAEEQPVENPPAEEPPQETPPAEEQPVENPPAEEPPQETPPAKEQPVENPPAEEPPEETPPAEEPPAEEPPAEEPPVENPPAEEPPAEEPPVENPPAEDNKVDAKIIGTWSNEDETEKIVFTNDGKFRLAQFDSYLTLYTKGTYTGTSKTITATGTNISLDNETWGIPEDLGMTSAYISFYGAYTVTDTTLSLVMADNETHNYKKVSANEVDITITKGLGDPDPEDEEDPDNPLAGKTFVRSEVDHLGNDMQQWTYLAKYVFKKDMTMEMITRQFTEETITHDKYTYTIDVENKTFTTVCTEYDLGDGTFIHSAEEAKDDFQKECFEETTYKYFLSDDHMVVQKIQNGSYTQTQIWIPLSKNPKFYENKVCRAVLSGQNGDVFLTSNGFVHFYFYSMGEKSICYNVEDENNEFALKYHKVFYETVNSDDFDIYYRDDADFNIAHADTPFYYDYEQTSKGIKLSSKIAPGQSLAELAEAGGLVVFAYDDENVSVSISPTVDVAVSPTGGTTYFLSIDLSGENKVTFTRKAEPKTEYEYTYELKFNGDIAKLELTAVSQNVEEQLEGLASFTMDYVPMEFEFEVIADFDEIN